MTYRDDGRDSGRVVPVTFGRKETAFDPLERVEAYWEEKRGNRLVPARSDIAPKGLEGALSNAFILERISTGLARFRISGSHLNDLIGLDVRGMPLSAVFDPAARDMLADAIAAVFDEPSAIRFEVSSKGGFGRKSLSGSMILLPLRSDLGEVSRVLGAVSMEGAIGRTPRRFEIDQQSRRGLIGYAGDEAVTQKTFRDPAPAQAVKPNLAPAKPLEQPKGLPSYLRLVADNALAD